VLARASAQQAEMPAPEGRLGARELEVQKTINSRRAP